MSEIVNLDVLSVRWTLPVSPDDRTFSKLIDFSESCHLLPFALQQKNIL